MIGGRCPLFYYYKAMISKQQVLDIIEEKVKADDCFVVEVKVSTTNKIVVLIDSMNGIGIDYCIQISRLIESSFDREEEDFELEVSTPGLGQALKVVNQYRKNIGREVEVVPFDAVPFKGELVAVNDESFEVKEEKKVKIEGKKKKELKVFNHSFKFDEVKSVKVIVSF